MADQEGNVFLTLLKDKVLWLLLRPGDAAIHAGEEAKFLTPAL